jgi:hypothetical protein
LIEDLRLPNADFKIEIRKSAIENALFPCQRSPNSQQFGKDLPRASCGRQPTVTVACPVDGELPDPVAFLLRPHNDFDIECKSVCDGLAVQVPCDVAFVHFKAALRIGELRRDFHIVDDEPVEYRRADAPVQALRFFDMTSPHFP